MPNVTVYRWRKYDIATDENQTSRRWATLEAIERACGERLGQGIEVDATELDPHVAGMTPRNWTPPSERHDGFQQRVTR